MRRFTYPTATAALTAALALGAVPPAAGADLTLELTTQGIHVSGATPGGRIALVGISRIGIESIVRAQRRDHALADGDGDGLVTLEVDGGPAERSVWVAVDLETGHWAVADGGGAPGSVLPVPGTPSLAAAESLDQPGGRYEVLLVRPAGPQTAAVWGGALGDGGASDGDGVADGSVRLAPAALTLVDGDQPAPAAFAAGDVLVLLAPATLAHAILEVTEPPPGSAHQSQEVSR